MQIIPGGWQHAWKAILAFLGLFVTNLIADWMNKGEVFPSDLEDGLRWVLSIGLGTAMVYLKRNADPVPAVGRHAKLEE